MTYYISPQDLQKNSKKILEDINKSKKPAIIIKKKKPVGVIITYNLFSKIKKTIHLKEVLKEALEEHNQGETRTIATEEDFKAFEKEVLEEAK